MLLQLSQWGKGTRPASGIQTGSSPKNLAPSLFQKSKRKKISVLKATENNRWISHITPILTFDELHDFILLWEEITSVTRVEDSEDKIKWKWTSDGIYTTHSAYQIQFRGRYKKLAAVSIWRAKAEPKCRIFAWILLQHKILTVNNLAKQGWTHDHRYANCAKHLQRHRLICAWIARSPGRCGCTSPHSSGDMTYNNLLLALLMGGGNVYDDLLTRNKDLRLTDSFYTFGGIFGKNEIEEFFNMSQWK
jgi:hypothetical protein